MPAGAYQFQVGTIRCTVLSDGYFSYPSPWFFPDADPCGLPRDSVVSPYTCLLIETGRHVALVDTGAGEGLTTTGAIMARLDMAGIRPRNVDTVILTHAHSDHIGGALDLNGSPAFPHARYILSEAESDCWTAQHPALDRVKLPDDVKCDMVRSARRCLAGLRHQLELTTGEIEIVPGVRILPAPGHTPGHLAVLLESEGERLLNVGDAAAHPLHLEHPEWHNGFDHAPEQAVGMRRELLDRAVREGMHLMAFHFPFPSFGRITTREGGGWDWRPGW